MPKMDRNDQNDAFSKTYVHQIKPEGSFSLIQANHNCRETAGADQHVSTVGEVHLRRLPEVSNSSLESQAHVSVGIFTEQLAMDIQQIWIESTGYLEISTPEYASTSGCISIEVVVWLPKDMELSDIVIDVIDLKLQVENDFDVHISQSAIMKTVSGGIDFLPGELTACGSRQGFNGREIVVDTASGAVTGPFPLFDLLKLSSKSGQINVSVDPQASSPTCPAPATLDITTVSGSISVRFPIYEPHKTVFRNYVTTVRSTSGTVRGDFYLGTNAKFSTISGSIDLNILPILQVGQERGSVLFSTNTKTGSTSIAMRDPIFFAGTSGVDCYRASTELDHSKYKLRALSSKHDTISAALDIRYQAQFEGTVEVDTVCGGIDLKGQGLDIIRRGRDIGGCMYAKKGPDYEHASKVKCITVSGSVGMRIT